jgi:hypothetical protein
VGIEPTFDPHRNGLDDHAIPTTIQPDKSRLLAACLLCEPVLDRGKRHSFTEQVFDLGMDVAGTHGTGGLAQHTFYSLRDQATTQPLVTAS